MKGPIVNMSNVSVAIEGNPVLRDVSWQMEDGENWVVVGPNGAGKTTLLRLLNGYHWPSSGQVSVLSKPFGKVDLRELRRRIGFVSSFISDWIPEDERVVDVVMSGKYASIRLWKEPPRRDLQHANLMLRRVGCERYMNAKFGKLSQGEKQRIIIARALMANPRLLVLDEPCASLDLPAREAFLSTVTEIARRKTPSLIYVTHRIEEIPAGFTHALLIKAGRVLREGKIDAVLDNRHLSKCFGVKVKVSKWRNRYYAMIDE
jgi:iron complex transport system ATP-binding protein